MCLCLYKCGALYVLPSGSEWGEKGGREVAAENGTKLAGDNNLVARENSAILILLFREEKQRIEI